MTGWLESSPQNKSRFISIIVALKELPIICATNNNNAKDHENDTYNCFSTCNFIFWIPTISRRRRECNANKSEWEEAKFKSWSHLILPLIFSSIIFIVQSIGITTSTFLKQLNNQAILSFFWSELNRERCWKGTNLNTRNYNWWKWIKWLH